MDVQDWWSGGELVPLELSGIEQGVFVRREGAGPSMTLLHGFRARRTTGQRIFHSRRRRACALAEPAGHAMPSGLGPSVPAPGPSSSSG